MNKPVSHNMWSLNAAAQDSHAQHDARCGEEVQQLASARHLVEQQQLQLDLDRDGYAASLEHFKELQQAVTDQVKLDCLSWDGLLCAVKAQWAEGAPVPS